MPGALWVLLCGLAVAVQRGPRDAQDGESEQDGEGHIGADEGRGEERGHDREGGRGGMGQRGEEGGGGAGEGGEHEGGEAERPDAGAGRSVMGVVHASPPAVCLLYMRWRIEPLVAHLSDAEPARQ